MIPHTVRRAALAIMVVALAAYVALHTPLRGVVAGPLGITKGCFLCRPSVAGSSVADALAAIALIVASAAAAAAVTWRVEGPTYERPVVFGLAFAAFVTVPSATLAGIASALGGSYLRAPAGPWIASIPAAIAVVVAMSTRQRGTTAATPPRPSGPPRSPLVIVVAVTAVGLALLAAAASLLHPPTQGDALSYHAALGVWFWRDGNLTAMLTRAPGTWAFAHPGTSELWAGLLRLAGGERLADLAQLPAAFLGAAAVGAFARRTGLRAGAALLAAGAFLLVPMVALQIGTQANDVTGAAFVIAAVALASAPRPAWTRQRAALVGIALGLATATKLALLPTIAIVGAYAIVVIVRWRPRWSGRSGAAVPLACFALAFGVVVAPWWIRNIAREHNPVFPQSLPLVGHGINVGAHGGVDADFVPRKVAWPAYPLIEAIDDRSGLGPLFAGALLPGLAIALWKGRRRPVLLLLGAFVGTLPFWWRYTLHEPRFFLPHFGLALVCVPWALLAVSRRRRTLAAWLVAGAALLSVALAVNQQLAPLATQPADRAAFYDRVFAVDPAALALPETDGVLQATGYGLARVDYASTYPLLGPGQRRLLMPMDADEIRGSRQRVITRMRSAGVRYAYVTAVPSTRAAVESLFGGPDFRVVESSTVVTSGAIGARRPLFRPASASATGATVRRYVFELTASAP